jgi:uncharacterized membrane protein
MSTLTVWKFSDTGGAERALETLQGLEKEGLIRVDDAAVVSWPQDARKPKTHQLHSTTGAGALGGTFWGFLFGLIFFVPLLGMAIGAATGALAGSLTDVGIDDDFIDQVREKITPGTSALFAMTENAVLDRVKGAFGDTHAELLFTNLSDEQDKALREAFGTE